MKKFLTKLSDGLNAAAIAVGAVFVAVTLVSGALQVFTRYVLNDSLSWTEELCRYASIVVYSLGFSVAVKFGSNPSIDILSGLLKGKAKTVQQLYCHAASFVCCLLISVFGIKVIHDVAGIRSPALGLPTSYMYGVIIAGILLSAVHSLTAFVNQLAQLKGGSGS